VQRDVAERPGVVMVVALDAAGRILLVPAAGAFTALPARQIDQSDQDPLAAAQQLLAEAGLRADTWNTLLDLPALPDETTAPSRIYLARDLRPVPAAEKRIRRSGNGEHIQARPRITWLTLDHAVSDVFANVIRNGPAATAVVAAAQARDTCWAGLQSATTNPDRQ
jgi:ADP-ribose pyrophosphatase